MLFDPIYVKELNANELKLLLIMKVMANGSGYLEASRPTIHEWMAYCSDKTIKRTIDSLILKGYLSKSTSVGRKPSTYTFLK